jgi:hypothetical protein
MAGNKNDIKIGYADAGDSKYQRLRHNLKAHHTVSGSIICPNSSDA